MRARISSIASSAAASPISGLEPAPRPSVRLAPSWILCSALRSGERLHVGVGDDELDVAQSCRDHVVDGVAAGAAHSDRDDARVGIHRVCHVKLDRCAIASCQVLARHERAAPDREFFDQPLDHAGRLAVAVLEGRPALLAVAPSGASPAPCSRAGRASAAGTRGPRGREASPSTRSAGDSARRRFSCRTLETTVPISRSSNARSGRRE